MDLKQFDTGQLEDVISYCNVRLANVRQQVGAAHLVRFFEQFIEELLSAYKNSYLFLKLIGNYVTLNVSRSEVEKQKLLTME